MERGKNAAKTMSKWEEYIYVYEPGSKLLVLGMVIQPLIGILIMGI